MELIKVNTKTSYYGAIPEDWIDCLFGDVLDGFSSGMTPYRGNPEFYRGRIPWITSGELKYSQINDTIEKITPDAIKKTNLKILPVGTFLMAITGLEAAGTRGSCGVTGIEATTNQSCMALFPKEGKILTEYLYHFYVHRGNELAFKFCQGTKQQSYTARIAKLLPIILPPTLTEQKAIASALSDVDELISSLERLITKKKAIKHGAMQELLGFDSAQPTTRVPKRRLPGFSGEWEEKALGEIITDFQNGYAFSASGYKEEGIPIVTMAQIGLSGQFQFDENKVNYWSSEELKNLKSFTLFKGDLIISMTDVTPEKNLIGRMAIVNEPGPLFLNQRVGHLRINQDLVNPVILKHLSNMRSWRTYSKAIASLGVQANIGTTDIKNGTFWLPKIDEQNAIAQILSDMDLEIEGLEAKKAKYQGIKQGMMQELLTGKIRLV